MSVLWTPEARVSRAHVEGTRAWEQDVLGAMHMVGGILDHWNAELKQIDPNLRLMQAGERVSVPGVMAGHYHLVRLRDPMKHEMLLIVPLRGPDNEFIEPSSQMLEALRMCDLQNNQVVRAQREAQVRAGASAERAAQKEEEDRLAEGVERFKAASRTQVLMSPDVPWSQNNSPAARRDRGERR